MLHFIGFFESRGKHEEGAADASGDRNLYAGDSAADGGEEAVLLRRRVGWQRRSFRSEGGTSF